MILLQLGLKMQKEVWSKLLHSNTEPAPFIQRGAPYTQRRIVLTSLHPCGGSVPKELGKSQVLRGVTHKFSLQPTLKFQEGIQTPIIYSAT